jgi:hypothetical protein
VYQVDTLSINSDQIFEKIFKPWEIKISLSYGLKKTSIYYSKIKFTFNKLSERKFEKIEHIELIFLTTFRILFFFENNIIIVNINNHYSYISKFNNSVFFEQYICILNFQMYLYLKNITFIIIYPPI